MKIPTVLLLYPFQKLIRREAETNNYFLGLVLSSMVLLLGCQSGVVKQTAVDTGAGEEIVGPEFGNTEGTLTGTEDGGLLGSGIGHYLDKQAEELAQIAETRRTEKGIIAKLQGDTLFANNQTYLKPSAKKTLDQIAAILVKYPEDRILVAGHTDSTGSDELNAKLSVKRAESVYGYLVQKGVPAQHIQIEGMGELRPIASNADESGRAKNRRIELEITVDEKAYNKSHH